MIIKDYTIIQEKLLFLKEEVERTFGRRIASFGDCVALSNGIFQKTGQTLNVNTLRRFFGLVPYNNIPSGTTLNIISGYCGYRSFDEVLQTKSVENGEGSLKEDILTFLTSLFEIDIKALHDPVYFSLANRAIGLLNQNLDLERQFYKSLAKNPNGRTIYFEQFINVDGLNSFYGEGLHVYLREKGTIENEIFAHSLLIYKYWLTCDDINLEHHFKQLVKNTLPFTANASLVARYHSALLFYTAAKNTSSKEVLAGSRKHYNHFSSVPDAWPHPNSFELIVAQALAFTGYYDESLLYIASAKELYYQHDNYLKTSFYRSLLLCEAFVYFSTGDMEKAEILLRQINPQDFYFLSKKVETIIYFIIKSAVEDAYILYRQQIEMLIAETGYIRLESFLLEESKMNKNEQKNKKIPL